jgi:hypothetical protein
MVAILVVAAASCGAPVPAVHVTPTPDPAVTVPRDLPTSRPSPVGGSRDQRDPAWNKVENARTGDPGWQIPASAVAKPDALAAYATRASVLQGEPFALRVHSTHGAVTATAYRIGWYGGAGGRKVWQSEPVAAGPQPAAVVGPLNEVSAPWSTTMMVSTATWPEGHYLVLVSAAGRSTYVPIVVRSRTVRDRTVILSAVTTLQAYNSWGGYSSYKGPGGTTDRSRIVSFDRPYDNGGLGQYGHLELEAVQFIESLGLNLGYLTSLELEDEVNLTGAAAVVSLGHDEYYSVGMRRSLEAAVAGGTNLAYFGGNAMYWRMRFAASDAGERRRIEIFRYPEEDPVKNDPTVTTLWRSGTHANIESRLLGVAYVCMNRPAPFVVLDPGFFAFSGTGVVVGTAVPGLVGGEVDRVPSPKDVPRFTRIVAHSAVTCTPSLVADHSDAAYSVADSGAAVFSVGSLVWLRSILRPATTFGADDGSVVFAQKVTANVLRVFSEPRAGARIPATPNVREVYGSGSAMPTPSERPDN